MSTPSRNNSTLQKPLSNRLPAPALFVGPPSRNASNASLSTPQPKSTRNNTPITRQRSHLVPESKRTLQSSSLQPTASLQDANPNTAPDTLSLISTNTSAPFTRRQQAAADAADAEASSHAEAVWAEMQNTLEEVELSAIKGPGMDVFGASHSQALDSLRHAQIELAKAWARSEAEECEQEVAEKASAQDTDAADMLATDRVSKLGTTSTAEEKESGTDSSGNMTGFERSRLEQETEKDIELSRKRREANDRYFEKVNRGVLEVVMKLEEVAAAMKGVELESKEIWRDGDSVDTGSVKTAGSTG